MKDNNESAHQGSRTSPWPLILFFSALLFLLFGGSRVYPSQKEAVRQEVEKDLTAIANLKSAQISDWWDDQLEDASLLIPLLQEEVLQFISTPTEANAADLRETLSLQAQLHDYDEILLVSPSGEELFSLTGQQGHYSDYLPVLEQTFQRGVPNLLDLHFDPQHPVVHISVIAPLFDESTKSPRGALVFINYADEFLFPLLQSWPVPSDTAETLLVRQEESEVLFLNELRHQQDTALKLKISLDRDDVPAVMAVKGQKGYVEGIDYRGEKVVAVLLPIPESSWFLISKMDQQEAFADWYLQSALLLSIVIAAAALAGSLTIFLRQRERRAQFQAMYQKEARLRLQEQRHSIILNSIGDAVIATNHEGRVELLNPAAETLTGWTNQQAQGESSTDVFDISDARTGDALSSPIDQVLESGEKVELANHTKLTSRQGEEFQISDSAAPILNQDGQITGAVLAFQDVSEQYQMREALKTSERRYRDLVETTASISWEYDVRRDLWTYVSPQAAEILGWDPKEWKDLQFWVDQLHPDDREEARDYCLACAERGEDHQLVYRFRKKGGGYVWLRDVVVVETDQQQPVLLRGVMFDITSQKETERELLDLKDRLEEKVAQRTEELEEKIEKLDKSEQAMLYMVEDLNQMTAELKEKSLRLEHSNQELEAFSYSVSHDLKAPLRAIDGFSRFLLEDYHEVLDQEGKRLVSIIRQNVARMDQLISDLLSLSRVSRAEITPRKIAMKAVTESIYHELASPMERKNFDISIAEMPPAFCDLFLIKQVWRNLIANALKYSAKSETKKIVIGFEEDEKEITYFIRDHGAGFNPKYQEKLFGVFQRLHSEDEFEGSGVGLAIVKRIIQRHRGKVWAEGKINQGAVFYFSLPKNTQD